MFPAPGDKYLVALVAFIFTLVISVLKVASRHEGQPPLHILESVTEFPIDATAAWLSLGFALLVANDSFNNAMLINVLLLLGCVAAQVLALRKLRGVLLATETEVVKRYRVFMPTVNWALLGIGLLAVVSIAGEGA